MTFSFYILNQSSLKQRYMPILHQCPQFLTIIKIILLLGQQNKTKQTSIFGPKSSFTKWNSDILIQYQYMNPFSKWALHLVTQGYVPWEGAIYI